MRKIDSQAVRTEVTARMSEQQIDLSKRDYSPLVWAGVVLLSFAVWVTYNIATYGITNN